MRKEVDITDLLFFSVFELGTYMYMVAIPYRTESTVDFYSKGDMKIDIVYENI